MHRWEGNIKAYLKEMSAAGWIVFIQLRKKSSSKTFVTTVMNLWVSYTQGI
jgi:hypothetical protein